MIKTQNIGLMKPNDGAEEWGMTLNDNFDIIDSKINSLLKISTSQFINSGLYEALETNKLLFNDKNEPISVQTPILKCYFSNNSDSFANSNMPGTSDQIAITITLEECESVQRIIDYNNYLFGIKLENNIITKIITTSINDFKSNDGNIIYLGNLVAAKVNGKKHFIPQLSMLKPWFCNFSSENREIDLLTHGTLNGGTVKLDGVNLKSDTPITWVHEGIDPTTQQSLHVWQGKANTDNNNNIEFLYLYPNNKIDTNELVIKTDLDATHFLKNSAAATVTENYFTVQRYGVLENRYSVICYGNKEFETEEEAINSIPFLDDVIDKIFFKEIAYIIIQNKSDSSRVIKIINKNPDTASNKYGYFNENDFTIFGEGGLLKFKVKNNHTLSLDPFKNNYIIGDAASNYSNGIIPSSSNDFKINGNTLTYNKFKVLLITNDLYGNTDFNIVEVGNEGSNAKALKILENKWYKLFWNQDFKLVDINSELTTNDILIGYCYSNGSTCSTNIIAPQLATTLPSERRNYEIAKISVGGLFASVSPNKQIAVQNGKISSEGIRYKESVNPNIKTISSITSAEENRITWEVIDNNGNITNSNQNILHSVSNKFVINTMFITADGRYFMLNGTQSYNSLTEARANLYTELNNINSNIMLEITRFIVPPTESQELSEVYYTNQKILGQLQISVVDPAQLKPNYNITDFTLFNNSDQKLKFVQKDSTLPSEINIFDNGIGIGNIKAPSGSAATNNYYLKYIYNDGNPYYVLSELDISALTSKIEELERRLKAIEDIKPNEGSFVTYTVKDNGSTSDSGVIGSMRFRGDSSRKFIEIYNGQSWEIMNTWQ